jgi:tRNA G37 N-methylase Trm5
VKASLKSLLSASLSPEDVALIYRSFDVTGDVAVIRVPESSLHHSEVIAE